MILGWLFRDADSSRLWINVVKNSLKSKFQIQSKLVETLPNKVRREETNRKSHVKSRYPRKLIHRPVREIAGAHPMHQKGATPTEQGQFEGSPYRRRRQCSGRSRKVVTGSAAALPAQQQRAHPAGARPPSQQQSTQVLARHQSHQEMPANKYP